MSIGTDRLDGWGQIEEHTGCTRKAYLRRGYPIHYEATGRVYALRSELASHGFGQYVATYAQVRPQTAI